MEDWRGTYEPLPRCVPPPAATATLPPPARSACGPRTHDHPPPRPTRSMAEDGAADGGAPDPHALLLGGEEGQWETVGNLDQFFSRIYRWGGPGLGVLCCGVTGRPCAPGFCSRAQPCAPHDLRRARASPCPPVPCRPSALVTRALRPRCAPAACAAGTGRRRGLRSCSPPACSTCWPWPSQVGEGAGRDGGREGNCSARRAAVCHASVRPSGALPQFACTPLACSRHECAAAAVRELGRTAGGRGLGPVCCRVGSHLWRGCRWQPAAAVGASSPCHPGPRCRHCCRRNA